MDADFSQCTRSPTFWYDEGNVVLRVEDTLFRMHRGVLQTHSAVFKDTFGMPQPEGEPLLEGCQVVPMMGDTVEDWENMLTFMYQPLKLNPTIPDIPVDKLCSLMRVARKYQFDDLFNTCIKRLRDELPVTLDAFDKLHPALASKEDRFVLGGTPLTGPAENLIKIINVALELDIECILPCAYYLVLSRLPLERIPLGVTSSSGNGQRVVLDLAAQEAVLCGLSVIFFDMLSSIRRFTHPSGPQGIGNWEPWCAEERQWALQAAIERRMMMDETFDPTGFTIDWPDCKKAIVQVQPRVLQFLSHVRGKEFVLARGAQDQKEMFGGMFTGLCEVCAKKELELRDSTRQLFWNRLPTVFGIGRGRKDAAGNVAPYAKTWQQLSYYDGSF